MSWKSESYRHSLASRGVKTGSPKPLIVKNRSELGNLKITEYNLHPTSDIDSDGVINSLDCKPLNKEEQGRIHDFFARAFERAKVEGKLALEDLKKVSSMKEFVEWSKKHRVLLETAGATLIVATVAFAPSLPMILIGVSKETGEIVSIVARDVPNLPSRIARLLQGLIVPASAIPLKKEDLRILKTHGASLS